MEGAHGLEIMRDAVRKSPPAKGLLRQGFLNLCSSVVALRKDKGGVIKSLSSLASSSAIGLRDVEDAEDLSSPLGIFLPSLRWIGLFVLIRIWADGRDVV